MSIQSVVAARKDETITQKSDQTSSPSANSPHQRARATQRNTLSAKKNKNFKIIANNLLSNAHLSMSFGGDKK